MVYMVADDDDGVFTNDHMGKELDAIREAVTRHPAARIAIQEDIRQGGLNRYFVEDGALVKQDIRNRAPGSVATIRDFIKFGTGKHPSEHNLFIFWGHGFGPAGLRYGRLVLPKDLRTALRSGFGLLGPPIDIVAFMSCQMSVVELAYEFSEWIGIQFTRVADHIIASQGSVQPEEPFPYGELLPLLSRDTDDAKAVATGVVNILNKNGSGKGLRFVAPFSLVDVRNARRVADALKALAADIVATNPFKADHSKLTQVQEAMHDALDAAHTHDLSLLDLGRLGRRFGALPLTNARDAAERSRLERLRAAGAQLSRAVEDAFVVHRHDGNGHTDTGASVFCPTHHDPGTKAANAMHMRTIPTVEFAVARDIGAYRDSWFARHTNWNQVVDQARNADG